MSERLPTAREVAEQLGISVETSLRWAAAGKLPSIRLSSRAIRFRRSAIEEWIAEHETGAVPREGDSQPGDRARRRGYAAVPLDVTANPPPGGGNNRGGS